MDYNQDGKISIEDFNDIFCSYGGNKMNSGIWNELLKEADAKGEGVISEGEFQDAMVNVIRNSLKLSKNDKSSWREYLEYKESINKVNK